MATVNVSISLKKQAIPATQSPTNQLAVKLMQSGAVLAQNILILPGVETNFGAVPDGTYTVSAERIGMGGAVIGDPVVSAPFTVVNTVDVDVPDVVSITI